MLLGSSANEPQPPHRTHDHGANGRGTSDARFQTRCVLWHSGASQLPGELLNSLTKKIGRLVVCTDAYAALAEACLTDREYRDATGAGVEGHKLGRAGVLLVVVPLPDASIREVVEAAEQYAPNVQRWVYDRSANPKLRPLVVRDVSGAQPPQTEGSRGAYFQPPAQPTARPAAPTPVPQSVPTRDAPPPQVPRLAPIIAAPAGLQLARQVQDGPRIAISGPGLGGPDTSSEDAMSQWTAAANGQAGGTRDFAPVGTRLRIAGGGEPLPAPNPERAASRPAPLLTADELQMLLSDDPLPPPAGTNPPSQGGAGNRGGVR